MHLTCAVAMPSSRASSAFKRPLLRCSGVESADWHRSRGPGIPDRKLQQRNCAGCLHETRAMVALSSDAVACSSPSCAHTRAHPRPTRMACPGQQLAICSSHLLPSYSRFREPHRSWARMTGHTRAPLRIRPCNTKQPHNSSDAAKQQHTRFHMTPDFIAATVVEAALL